MIIGLALFLIAIGGLVFTLVSPWWFTPLASNWASIDTTTFITLVITGIAFLAINLFLGYAVIRYRQRQGSQAEFIPENPKLEKRLIAMTALGIVVLLAPGMIVYSNFISPPEDAMQMEVLAEQWNWMYRFPGEDGQFGRTSQTAITPQNPYGLDREDPAAQDDVLVRSSTVHLPVNVPVDIQLRSKDVLHNWYVPQFRVKMDAVPGMVTNMWLTPTKTGTYEVVCAEYCGTGHFSMSGEVVVEERAAFEDWLAEQPTLAGRQQPSDGASDTQDGADQAEERTAAERGRQVAMNNGCLGCHSPDGSQRSGPTWQGLYGSEVSLASGETVTADEDYIIESIRQPQAKIHQGFGNVAMPSYGEDQINNEELQDLIAYIRSLSDEEAQGEDGSSE